MVAGHSFCRTNIRWQERPDAEKDDGDGQSADSSRCPSRGGSDSGSEHNEEHHQYEGRFPPSSTMDKKTGRRKSRSAVEVVELRCENDTEAALQDLLGLRVSGSRSVGVFVQSVHGGSVADMVSVVAKPEFGGGQNPNVW